MGLLSRSKKQLQELQDSMFSEARHKLDYDSKQLLYSMTGNIDNYVRSTWSPGYVSVDDYSKITGKDFVGETVDGASQPQSASQSDSAPSSDSTRASDSAPASAPTADSQSSSTTASASASQSEPAPASTSASEPESSSTSATQSEPVSASTSVSEPASSVDK